MKLTLTNVKTLKKQSNNALEKHVCNYVINRWNDYDDKTYIFRDVLNYGCQSGVVSELIYYSDTVAFYKRYRTEINEMISRIMQELGIYNPCELFGERWETDDPLATDVYNQNLLAWFGFEETLRCIAYHFESLENYI